MRINYCSYYFICGEQGIPEGRIESDGLPVTFPHLCGFVTINADGGRAIRHSDLSVLITDQCFKINCLSKALAPSVYQEVIHYDQHSNQS